jgi:hypothetical protein
MPKITIGRKIVNKLKGGGGPDAYEFVPVEELKARCEEQGFDCILSDDSTLQVDIDSEAGYKQYLEASKTLCLELGKTTIKTSVSGNSHKHITIKLLKPLSVLERVAFQACLGSDLTRETLCIRDYLDGDPNPILFIEEKESGGI